MVDNEEEAADLKSWSEPASSGGNFAPFFGIEVCQRR
jgi:hypothetical protein